MSVVPSLEILNHLNTARTNPKKFAECIQKQIQLFYKDNRTLPLVPGCDYRTNEGKGAWIECKNYLEVFKPVEPLTLSKSLCYVAEDHAADMAQHNFQGHTGSDGSKLSDRINRRCNKVLNAATTFGQNIGGDFKYQGRDFALNTVKSLLIDDGVDTRGHRKNILSNDFRFVGIGSRVLGNKIRVVMVFHSHDPELKNDKAPLQTGTQLKFQKILQKKEDVEEIDKKIVGKKTSTSTKTMNGKTTTKITQILTYSDGSTQTRQITKTSG